MAQRPCWNGFRGLSEVLGARGDPGARARQEMAAESPEGAAQPAGTRRLLSAPGRFWCLLHLNLIGEIILK